MRCVLNFIYRRDNDKTDHNKYHQTIPNKEKNQCKKHFLF